MKNAEKSEKITNFAKSKHSFTHLFINYFFFYMKKVLFTLALACAATAANAQQSLLTGEFTDNVYVGANLGVNTNLAGNKVFPLNPTFGIRVGKDINPVFGVNVEATTWFGSHAEKNQHYIHGYNRFDTYPQLSTVRQDYTGPDGEVYYSDEVQRVTKSSGHNFFRATNLGINGTLNLTNLLNGYLAEPQNIEVITQVGFGWGHVFSPSSSRQQVKKEDRDVLTLKTGFDVAYNFGDEKEHQLYVEPAILWNLNKDGHSGIQMDKHYAYFSLSLGYNYKFGCSYGGHNFKFGRDCDIEIARLNAMLEDCRKNPQVVEKVVERVVEGGTRTISIDNLKVVPFEQGKWDISEDAKVDLNSIKPGSHVQIIGTASPEGNAEWNQKLSMNRANAVAAYLESRGVIIDAIEGRGVEGKTSNRLAIVYVL